MTATDWPAEIYALARGIALDLDVRVTTVLPLVRTPIEAQRVEVAEVPEVEAVEMAVDDELEVTTPVRTWPTEQGTWFPGIERGEIVRGHFVRGRFVRDSGRSKGARTFARAVARRTARRSAEDANARERGAEEREGAPGQMHDRGGDRLGGGRLVKNPSAEIPGSTPVIAKAVRRG